MNICKQCLISILLFFTVPVAALAETQEVIAEIYGKQIAAKDICKEATCSDEQLGKNLFGLALGHAMNEFADMHKEQVEPEQKEIDAFAATMAKDMKEHTKENPDLFGEYTPKSDEEMEAGFKSIAPQYLAAWKLNKMLYEIYGGKVIFQQAGPEPLTAYQKLLEAAMSSGKVKLLDTKLESGFNWYLDPAHHTLIPEEEAKKIMSAPQ